MSTYPEASVMGVTSDQSITLGHKMPLPIVGEGVYLTKGQPDTKVQQCDTWPPDVSVWLATSDQRSTDPKI